MENSSPTSLSRGYYKWYQRFCTNHRNIIADIEIASLVPALCLEGTYCLQGTSTPTGTAKCAERISMSTGVHRPVSVVPGKFSLDNAGARGQFCFASDCKAIRAMVLFLMPERIYMQFELWEYPRDVS